MAKKAKDNKKKKGPKSKRARAKAKLDRQWGEEAKGGEDVILRRGKQRTTSQQNANEQPETTSTFNYKDASQPYSDEDDDASSKGSENDTEQAYSSLLESIRNKAKNKRNRTTTHGYDEDEAMQVHDSDTEVDMEKDSVMEEEQVNDNHSSSSEEAEEMQDLPTALDPFTDRFSQPPLDEQKIDQEIQTVQETTKVMVPHLDASMELQISKVWLDKYQFPVSSSGQKDWAKLARQFFACNGEILQQQWESNRRKLFSPLQTTLYPLMASYTDMLITTDTKSCRQETQRLALLHILNHVWTSRGRIHRHNRRIKEVEKKMGQVDIQSDSAWRDQGFTRPTVLVLLPTRGTCYDAVQDMLALLGDEDETVADNIDRLETEYGPPPQEEEEKTDAKMEATLRHRRKVLQQKGSEWSELFGDNANDDDDFKLGMALVPKGNKSYKESESSSCSVKLYTDFYKSDIIFASPLGLKMAIDEDADFLSSIEICLMGRADVLLMQNWDHVNGVMRLLNQQPKNNNDTDFARVRNYLLAGQAAHWRQLIVCSSLTDPLILSMFKRHAKSIAGQVKIRRRVPPEDASISHVLLPIRQVFQRVSCTSFAKQSEDRLKYFESKVLPALLRHKQKHTMIFVPSYFDFVSIRNLFLKREVEFVSVTEYSRTTEMNRGRARFLQGRKPLMLYTGRAHFFHRHAIKGARHIIFFGLPEYAEFYASQVNLLNEGLEVSADTTTASCQALFTKYDSHALERIVGTSNCSRMIKGEKSTFLFVS